MRTSWAPSISLLGKCSAHPGWHRTKYAIHSVLYERRPYAQITPRCHVRVSLLTATRAHDQWSLYPSSMKNYNFTIFAKFCKSFWSIEAYFLANMVDLLPWATGTLCLQLGELEYKNRATRAPIHYPLKLWSIQCPSAAHNQELHNLIDKKLLLIDVHQQIARWSSADGR